MIYNLILNYEVDKHSFQERNKYHYLCSDSSINNIDKICETICLENKHLKTVNKIYKKMDLIELKKNRIVEKLLFKLPPLFELRWLTQSSSLSWQLNCALRIGFCFRTKIEVMSNINY